MSKTREAGPELDREVAERVMGGTCVDSERWECWDDKPERRKVCRLPDGGILSSVYGDWSPSTNIADAWEVVEVLFRRGMVRISNGDGDSCDVDFFPFNGVAPDSPLWTGNPAHVSAATAPLAICLAALAAVGELTP